MVPHPQPGGGDRAGPRACPPTPSSAGGGQETRGAGKEGSNRELCYSVSDGQPQMSASGSLRWPPYPCPPAGGARHSCGWEPRMEANGAAAAADATADAARPLHTHPSLRPPSSRSPERRRGPPGSCRQGRLVGGLRRPGLAKWSEGVSEEAVGEGGGGRDAAATRVMREPARGAGRMAGRRGMCVPGRWCWPEGLSVRGVV